MVTLVFSSKVLVYMVTKTWLSFCAYMSAEQAVAMQNHCP